MKIGNKIKKLRLENNMTQEELAKKLYVTRNAISKWENNNGIPNIDSLVEITKLFNITLDSLFLDEEIDKISLEKKEKKENTKNIVCSFILFIVYALIGILIPHFCFLADPTSGIAVFLIFLPLSYIILGIITVIFKIHWPYVMISSAIAVIPIYIYFDGRPSISIGYSGIIYLLLFYGSYFIMLSILDLSIFKNNFNYFKKLFLIISCSLSLLYVVHNIIYLIFVYNSNENTIMWTTVILLNLFYYIIPLVVSFTLLIVFSLKSRKNKLTINNTITKDI